MSSWEEIEDHTYLDSISVTVIEATHHDDEKLDWGLVVEDTSGKQFEIEIWQKHDPLFEWEEGAEYEIRNAYGQTWDNGQSKKLHSSKKWSVDRVQSIPDCRLMIMGDSHVGRKEHPSKSYQSIDCAGKFKQAVEVAVAHEVDCVVHTGDVFHDHATEEDCNTVDKAFERMENADVDFHYILGNHECNRGKQLLQRWERRGVATHINLDGTEIADGVKIYGYDHRPRSEFSVDDMDHPILFANSVSILILHQTLSPFHTKADADLDEINAKSFGSFDYVVSGHIHDPEQPDWDDGEFLYAGSTEDLSTNNNPSDPSVWFLTVEEESITTHRRRL